MGRTRQERDRTPARTHFQVTFLLLLEITGDLSISHTSELVHQPIPGGCELPGSFSPLGPVAPAAQRQPQEVESMQETREAEPREVGETSPGTRRRSPYRMGRAPPAPNTVPPLKPHKRCGNQEDLGRGNTVVTGREHQTSVRTQTCLSSAV
jgi:hypothetical protein